MECDICKKTFMTAKQLSGHKSIHRENGRYSVSRKRHKPSICLNCDKEIPYNKNTKNKYCSSVCFNQMCYNTIESKLRLGEHISTKTLRKYILKKFDYKCCLCELGEWWNNKKLSLHLDHIDGNSDNDDILNLRILCPNCHSQTETHGNKRGMIVKHTKRNEYLRKYKSGWSER